MIQTPARPDIIAIGASAGGVAAAVELIRLFPRTLPATILLVVHRSTLVASMLPAVVASKAKIEVELAREGGILRHGVCYIAPEDQHLIVTSSLRLHLMPNGFYRAHNIDALFGSLARCAGPRTIGVILSGLLRDGSMGLKALKESGGLALVQDPGEAEFPDMPRNAIAYDGPVDAVGPVDVLAREICARLGCLQSAQ